MGEVSLLGGLEFLEGDTGFCLGMPNFSGSVRGVAGRLTLLMGVD